MGLLDEIRKALESEKKSEFLDQILKEKSLHDALHDAGFSITVDDPQARARQQPFGLLSTLHKIDLVDLITEITLIKQIDLVAAITNIANLASLDLIDRITLIDLITKISEITTIKTIESVTIAKIQSANSSTTSIYASTTLTDDNEKTIKEITEAGETDHIDFGVAAAADSDHVQIQVYCDDLLCFHWDFNTLNARGFSASTPTISLLSYTVNGQCFVHITSKFVFKTKLKLTMKAWLIFHPQTVWVEGLVNILR